jgi:hypothetical protein
MAAGHTASELAFVGGGGGAVVLCKHELSKGSSVASAQPAGLYLGRMSVLWAARVCRGLRQQW